MSIEFNAIRWGAVRVAKHEIDSNRLSQLIETGRENYGGRITVYLQIAGVSQRTMEDETARGAANRMWCGMFIYYCYHEAAGGRPLPFHPSVLWGGRGLVAWANAHPATIVDPQSRIEPGDIFVTRGFHIGMATGNSDGSHTFSTIEGNQGDLAHNDHKGIARKQFNVKGCRVIVRI